MFRTLAALILIGAALFTAPAEASEYRWCKAYPLLNQKLGCEKDNYLVRFGQKYCEVYVRTNETFSPKTQVTLRKIRHCLVKDALLNPSLSCANSEAMAMKSHIGCYLESGFCKVPLHEQVAIWWLAKSETVQPSFLRTMYAVRAACRALALSHL